jgi:mannan endo-1,4-beta-mannosidase
MLTRRDLLLSSSLLMAGCATATTTQSQAGNFVRRDGSGFRLRDRPYRFVGTNMWYAAYLGADAEFGDRTRLRRELDSLVALGIDNVRILGSSELSPLKGSITPAFRTREDGYSQTLLGGLDYAIAEMGRRDMRAVVYLTNFWEWSGGMATYLYWTNGGRYIDMNDPAHPWPEFPDFVADFYASAEAVGMYRDYIQAVVTRRNSVNGARYVDDPTIMSWQLANEPRPGGSDAVGVKRLPAYLAWIADTARLIKSLDPNHLVSTGSEGSQGCLGRDDCALQAHQSADVDYVTAHIWPQNWGWVNPNDLAGSWDGAAVKVRDYIARQIAIAETAGKPLVIEEFGFPRDDGSFDPGSTTTFKDRFYATIYAAVEASMLSGGPVAGSNFWAWGGEGRAHHADRRFRPGDAHYMGDPPHEPQGWYSVLDSDQSTLALIRAHAGMLKSRSAGIASSIGQT